MRWRFLLHALDRTGPPRLAQGLIEWWAAAHPTDDLEVIALRGGAVAGWFEARTRLTVVLADHAALPDAPLPESPLPDVPVADARAPEATLLISVSAAPLLRLLGLSGPMLCWVVETEEEYDPVLLRSDMAWAAGSEASRADCVRRLGCGGLAVPSVRLLPEFVASPRPTRSPAEVRQSLGLGEEAVLVLAAGIGTERKAPDLFVEMALRSAAVSPERGRPRFVWVGGEDGTLRQRADRWAEELRLDRVQFVPTVDDIDSYLAAADVFVHPAREDAFPLVCVAAAAVATPVVAFSGVGGVPEMLGDAFLGARYPDLAGLVDHVDTLVRDGNGPECGRAQQARVRSRYLAENGAPRVREALVQVAEEVS